MFSLVGQQLGNYHLHALLGRGGFADVYLGEHLLLQTHAAIKVLHAEMTGQELQRFIQEARTVAQLRHANIIRVLDFGVSGTTSFLVMDFAVYGSLHHLHPHGTLLPLATIVSYVKQIASALHYAHQQEIIHRDVKPENLLMDAEGSLLLSDFGLAIPVRSTQSSAIQAPFGTVRYMAPEQIRGKACPASDQYALAVIVYEWLSGTYPFDGESSISIAVHHLIDPPPALRERIPDLAPSIEQVVMRALAKEPSERYPTILAFAEALKAACEPYIQSEMRGNDDFQVYLAAQSINNPSWANISMELTLPVEPDRVSMSDNEVSLLFEGDALTQVI